MKKYITLMFLIYFTFSLRSQNRYNFGNKYTIGLSSSTTFIDKDVFKFKLNQKEILLQRILTKRISLIGGYGFSKNDVKFGYNRAPNYEIDVVDSNGANLMKVDISAIGSAVVRTSSVNLGVRAYWVRKGAVAPFGRFFELKVGYTTIRQRIEEDHFSYTGYYKGSLLKFSKDELPNYGIDHLNVLSFQLGYGASAPIVKNFYFDWLINTSLNIPMWTGVSQNSSSDYVHAKVHYRDLYLFENARINYNMNNLFKLNLGIHYGF